ncbi:MAG: hypothetical protein JO279_10705 [Verrucomicrobia bacterium]|nr:hypothetical protein [Verrucomicrobiota bacterium]
MNTYIPLVLTAIVTLSTMIYTAYSIQLWRTTRAAAEISRQAVLSNLWSELNRYLEILRKQEAPETDFMQKVSNLMLDYMIANLLSHALEKEDRNFEELQHRLSTLISENEAAASKVSWVAHFIKRRKPR